ncbi:hypothetical protein N1F89_07655 [Aquibium sp. A9E412]|uniref:hypothetical protein n=1 Tax=Aquibium sp. A9E412 TaxID=2976767 RepID=UPI0025AF7B4A|nr:hypothetical protein [Aquibium sp. A9E412]MDN2566093.1 hypothetical protein [Aquibium sp. A9E412]
MDLLTLNDRPWKKDGYAFPRHLENPRGMVGPEERRCYYWLGKNWYSGKGFIVDAGAFLGASTYCFAAGVKDGGHGTYDGHPPIHAYDYFKVVDKYVGETISKEFRPVEDGESYLDIFEYQTGRYHELITAHPGDFMKQKWTGDPIEILFIDIAKTQPLNSHAVGEFFAHLIPDRSVLVHQDYYHCWHPYIHISMEFFDEEFELVDELVTHQSRVWRLTKPLPKSKIDRIRNYDLDETERNNLLEVAIEKSSAKMRPMLELVKIWQLCIDKKWPDADVALRNFREKHDVFNRHELWAKQSFDVESHIAQKLDSGN